MLELKRWFRSPEATVGELTPPRRFAEKKVWIDEKIKVGQGASGRAVGAAANRTRWQFLAALPPVDATIPLPPTPSPVRKGELREWWEVS